MKLQLLGTLVAVTLAVSACSQAPAEVRVGSGRSSVRCRMTRQASSVPTRRGARGSVVFFRRYNRDGSLAWKTDANTQVSGGSAGVYDAEVDGAGNVYFAWYTFGTPSVPGVREAAAFISKHNPSGRLLYRKALPGEGVQGLATDASSLYATLTRFGGDSPNTYYVRKYSSGGGVLWTKELTVPDVDFGDDMGDVAGLDVAPGGSVFVAASRRSYGGLIFKLCGSDGRQLKSSPVSGQFALDVVAAGGSVYVHSFFDAPYDNQPQVSRFRPDGPSVWVRSGYVSNDEARYDADTGGITADAEGNVYLITSCLTAPRFR